jgi:hypothetical protein
MISRLKLLKGAALGTIASLLLVGKAEAQSPTAAIHYQGRLTNPDGSPVNDGSYSVVFRLYGDPTGGSALWQEAASVTTRSGAFATMLGRSSQFPNGLFNRPLWLEIEVNSRVLTPRQELGASPYAMTALGLVDGAVAGTAIANGTITGEKIKDHTITELQLAPGIAVPVGSVISWWGNAAAAPDGWAVCDGHTLSDSASPLNGLALPDLRDRFIRGGTGNVRSTPVVGGAATIDLSHSHTVNDHSHGMDHTHTVNDHSHGMDHYHTGTTDSSGDRANYYTYHQDAYTEVSDDHKHHFTTGGPSNGNTGGAAPGTSGPSNGNTGNAAPGTNTALSNAQSILPPYVGLIFIVRVR